ncbi:MAG TPA: phenylalanine--tRNA ligase subunit beta [Mycobacteriales bacterium]|nr:phenylalanine--tRNA ligase subunit beta [Mycobacteriales bacterium]
MLVPLSWLRDYVDLADGVGARDIADRLTAAGLQVERIERLGEGIEGVVSARVLAIEELSGFKKPIRWVTLADGTDERQVICGATNFAVGDVIAYARPPAMLPGGFRIEAREAYGHPSDGMICSGRELGISDDHSGILILDPAGPLGIDVVEALGLRDDVLDISINPDRGYALSVRGVAREVAISYDVTFRDPAALEVAAATSPGYDVRLEDSGCDRYLAVSLSDLDPTVGSPAWLQRRLVLGGMRPISLMVDVTNYVMLAVGQPTHAFDRATLRGPIVVRRARDGERLETLDGVDRELDPRDLLITDDSGPIALAGVMGGLATEITDATHEVLLESAHFEATTVAYTARRHRLGSEASRRFERGIDDALAPAAAELAVSLLTEIGAARRTGEVTDVDDRAATERITLDAGLAGRIAGVPYPPATVVRRLTQVGCQVGDVQEDLLAVAPPSWRPDLRLDVDLVEEVVRLEGYESLPSTQPRAVAGSGLTYEQRLRRVVSRTLAADGYTEVLCSPFVGAESAEALMLAAGDGRVPSVRIANPVSDAEPYLRATLLPGLFAALARNVGRGMTDIALFETGPVFRSRGSAPAPVLAAAVRPSPEDIAALDAALPDQPGRIAVVLAGQRDLGGWWGAGRRASWSDAISVGRLLGEALGVAIDVMADEHAPFHPGRCAALSIDGELIGHAGELHPRVVAAFGLPERAAAAELSLDALLGAAQPVTSAPLVSAYPAATIDIAVTVAADVSAAQLETALRDGAGELLEAIRLFDVYAGAQAGAGRKSMAFALRLRAPDRTLAADEVAAVRDSAVAVAADRFSAELRS